MGYTRALVLAFLVAMTTEAAVGLLPYAVQSSIVDLMDERDFIGLQRVKFSRENVRPIYRKDMGIKEVRLTILTDHVLPSVFPTHQLFGFVTQRSRSVA